VIATLILIALGILSAFAVERIGNWLDRQQDIEHHLGKTRLGK
jgi:capsular polysaccharide biosynthesis protein